MTDDDDELDPNSSIVYIALSMLCTNSNSLIPELLYLFNPKQIVNFIKIFSGETIKVPTVDEFTRIINTSLAVHHVIIEGKSMDWFAIKYELDGNYMNGIKARMDNWFSSLSEGEKQFIEDMRAKEKARKESKKMTRTLVKEELRQ
jgi:hypothetical protein